MRRLGNVVVSCWLVVGIVSLSSYSVDGDVSHRPGPEVASHKTTQPVVLYPIKFDPALYEIWGLADLRNGDTAVYAANKLVGKILIQNYMNDRTIYVDTISGESDDRFLAHGLAWTTWSWSSGVNQTFTSGSSKVTLVASDDDREVYGTGYFYESCLGPVSSYIKIETNGMSKDKVLLYVFPHPVKLIPANRCEQDIFSAPHTETRLIDPILVAHEGPDGGILLAGRSYVSMPVVLSVPNGFPLVGDGKMYFVVDKYIIDSIQDQAVSDYRAITKTDPLHATAGAGLATLIETRLLQYLQTKGAM